MKPINQVIGINKIAKFPNDIAKFLQIPNQNEYTGHCFRRTAATLLADTGADIVDLMRAGGWASRTVAEGYIAESEVQKLKIASSFADQQSNQTQECKTSNSSSSNHPAPLEHVVNSSITITAPISNTVFNVYISGQPGISLNK